MGLCSYGRIFHFLLLCAEQLFLSVTAWLAATSCVKSKIATLRVCLWVIFTSVFKSMTMSLHFSSYLSFFFFVHELANKQLRDIVIIFIRLRKARNLCLCAYVCQISEALIEPLET